LRAAQAQVDGRVYVCELSCKGAEE
jgi:hypothetical protein